MAKHALATPLDAPAGDYLFDRHDRPQYASNADYNVAYAKRRKYAAHREAMFESWRFVDELTGLPVERPYRDPGFEAHNFAELVERSEHLISSSDGWLPNRARFIYLEAYRENELRDRKRESDLHYAKIAAEILRPAVDPEHHAERFSTDQLPETD